LAITTTKRGGEVGDEQKGKAAMNLFGIKRVSPEERMKLWRRELKKQEREIERSIRGTGAYVSPLTWLPDIDREEAKVVLECKRAAKRGEESTVRILARQIVKSRQAKQRLYNSKAQLSSIGLTLTQQMGA
jgi:charged multivesicular body protein 3